MSRLRSVQLRNDAAAFLDAARELAQIASRDVAFERQVDALRALNSDSPQAAAPQPRTSASHSSEPSLEE